MEVCLSRYVRRKQSSVRVLLSWRTITERSQVIRIPDSTQMLLYRINTFENERVRLKHNKTYLLVRIELIHFYFL
jgi:hypothetical protein